MMQYDKIIAGPVGQFSYGPRCYDGAQEDGVIIECLPEEAQFWGLYQMHNGHWSWVVDLRSEDSAKYMAGFLSGAFQ